MQRYCFDTPVDRRGTNCVKYDEMQSSDIIPLWVADMDFETAPVIVDAMRKRLEHGCFGYTHVPESYYESVIDWFQRRHSLHLEREWFIYTIGIVPAISAVIKAATEPGDSVLVMTPVYNCFFSSIRNNGCSMVESPLVESTNPRVDELSSSAVRYEVDWADFEEKCSRPEVKVFLLCNPHNPAGRVWTAEELHRMGEICKRHNVLVLDDSIHCEFVRQPHRYTAFASASDAPCVTCLSPSKAFNIAGLQIANIICSDATMRQRIDRAININEVCDVNTFGVIALQAAYSHEGEEWLNQLVDYIYDNATAAEEFIATHLPEWHPVTLEGTYLLWVDISATGMSADDYADHLLRHAKVYVNPGTMYAGGGTTGNNFIRINLATQRQRLLEALERISHLTVKS